MSKIVDQVHSSLTRSPQKAEEIANSLGINREDTYRALCRLVDNGKARMEKSSKSSHQITGFVLDKVDVSEQFGCEGAKANSPEAELCRDCKRAEPSEWDDNLMQPMVKQERIYWTCINFVQKVPS